MKSNWKTLKYKKWIKCKYKNCIQNERKCLINVKLLVKWFKKICYTLKEKLVASYPYSLCFCIKHIVNRIVFPSKSFKIWFFLFVLFSWIMIFDEKMICINIWNDWIMRTYNILVNINYTNYLYFIHIDIGHFYLHISMW